MIDWKKLVGHYVLPSARPQGYEPGNVYIDNLVSDDLGTEILAVLNERFEGVKGIEYSPQEVPQRDQPISFSNTLRALAINQILHETGLDIHILSPEEVLKYYGIILVSIQNDESTYADTDSVLIGYKRGPNEKLRKSLIKDLGIVASTESLLVSGLGIEKSNDKYGVTLRKTDRTRIVPASSVAKLSGGEFFYENSGLRKVERLSGTMYAKHSDMVQAIGGSRVQVLRTA